MKKTFKFNFLLIIFIASISGCAPPAYVIDDSKTTGGMGSQTTVIIDDQRPQDDKEHSIGSLLVTSSEYGIWTLGDTQFQPPILELLKNSVIKSSAKQTEQPKNIKIKLKRLIINSNQQADLLRSTSSFQTPLAGAIAEAMHGKAFEMDISKTQPYVIGLIDSEIEVTYEKRKSYTKNISVAKADNFSSHMDFEGRKKAAIVVVKELMSEFTNSIYK